MFWSRRRVGSSGELLVISSRSNSSNRQRNVSLCCCVAVFGHGFLAGKSPKGSCLEWSSGPAGHVWKKTDGTCDGLWSKMTKVWPTFSVLSWEVTSLHYTWFVLEGAAPTQAHFSSLHLHHLLLLNSATPWLVHDMCPVIGLFMNPFPINEVSIPFHPFSATRKCCPALFSSWFQLWCFTLFRHFGRRLSWWLKQVSGNWSHHPVL